MNDLRIEDCEQQAPYAGLADEPATSVVPGYVAELRNVVLWLSKQPWPQHEDQTWDGLVAAYEASIAPKAAPEPHTVKVLKVGR